MTPKLIQVLLEPPADNSNTIFVDDVKIEDGVYAITAKGDICYVFQHINSDGIRGVIYIVSSVANNSFMQNQVFNFLSELMKDRHGYKFFTLSGKRIVLEKQEQGEYILAKDALVPYCFFKTHCEVVKVRSIEHMENVLETGSEVYQVQFS